MKYLPEPTLRHYIARYKLDKKILNRMIQNNETENRKLIEERIKRHERDIIEYVTTKRFEEQLKYLNL